MNLAEPVFEQNQPLLKQIRQAEHKGEHKSSRPAVHKFGGSSLRSASAIEKVATIIEQNCQRNDLIIVSAMGDTTDLLFDLVNGYLRAEQNEGETYTPDCTAIVDYQQGIIEQLLPEATAAILIDQLHSDIQRIVFLLSRTLAWQTLNQDDIISFGELWSTRVVSAALNQRGFDCERVDSREFIHTAAQLVVESVAQRQSEISFDQDVTDCQIDWDKSQKAFESWHNEFSDSIAPKLAVVSGYIAADPQGNTVTLGRNGSDFSATIIAKLCGARMVYLWTDVNGVYSADPNRFYHTKVLPVLGLNEARALANLGSPVFHEKTLKPLQDANIPIRIRNSQISSQNNAGTLILTQNAKWQGAKTIADKQSVCLFAIKWQNALSPSELHGESHSELNEQLKALLSRQQLSTWCWLEEDQTLQFCTSDTDQYKVEQLLSSVDSDCEVTKQTDLSIISLVGSDLLQHGEHLAAYYSLIKQSGKEVLLHHYDTNGAISAVINTPDPGALVATIHQAIFNSNSNSNSNSQTRSEVEKSTTESPVISLVLLGYGNIGRKLTQILSQQLDNINRISKSKLQLVAVANSRHYTFNPQGIDLTAGVDDIDQALAQSTLTTKDIEQSLVLLDDRRVAIVDVTASPDVASLYQGFFSKGRDVISACKLGITLPSAEYQQLLQLAKDNNSTWLSNVTCGAGLPIQQSISDLVLSGDKISNIAGLFSGSLSWILNRYDGKTSFSTVVAQAKALGLTEPDPRDDLSGKDVQRKLLIIARTMGLNLDLADIALTPLIPEHFLDLSVEAFAASSETLDREMLQKWQAADEQGLQLCYAGELRFVQQQGQTQLLDASVGISFRGVSDPLINVSAADNIVVIRSQWHEANPLIIRGPGAGVEVTAAGIVADLIKLAG